MALQMRQAPSKKARVLLSFVAVIAFVAQPVYGALSTRIASALAGHVVINEIKPSSVGGVERWVELYNPTDAPVDMSGWRIVRGSANFTNVFASNTIIGAHQRYVVESTSASLPQTSTSIVELWTGPVTTGVQLDAVDYGAGVAVGQSYGRESDGAETFTTFASPTKNAPNLASVASPHLNKEEFATINGRYKGISVGFNAKDFGSVTDVTVKLDRADGTSVVKQGNQGVRDLISNKTSSVQLTAPFVIQEGAFTEADDTIYWQPAPAIWSTATLPTSVTISVTDENGTKSVTNNTFNHGAPSWPKYESLLPPPPADTTAPAAPKITTPTDNQYFANSPIQNKWTAVTDPSGIANYEVEYKYDDGHTFAGGPTRLVPGTQTSRNHTPNVGEQGGVTIRVRAIDGAGNKSEYSAPVHYYYDSTAPSVTLQQLQNGDKFKKDEQFAVSAHLTDNVGLANYRLQIDGVELPHEDAAGQSQTLASTGVELDVHVVFNANDLTNGEHTVVVWAIDKAGNESPKVPRTIWIDKTLPTVTVKPESVGLNDHFKTVSFKLSDNDKVVKYFINGIERSLTPNKWSDANGIAVGKNGGRLGENTFTLVDATGNTTTYTFWLDNVSPEGAITYSNNNGNAVTADDVTATLTTNESIKTPEGWNKVNDTTFTKTHSENGKFSVLIEDLAGNSTTVRYEVKRIDRTAPVINGIVNGGLYRSPVTYSVTEQSIREIIVDGISYSEKNAPYTVSDEGLHAVKVIDKAGNAAEVEFTIDRTNPVVVLTSPGIGQVVGGSQLVVRGSVTDPSGISEYRYQLLDADKGNTLGNSIIGGHGAVENDTLGTIDISHLPSGDYFVRAWAKDGLGNTSSPFYVGFTVDHTAPTVTVNIVSSLTPSASTPIVLQGSISEAATLQLLVDGIVEPDADITIDGTTWTATLGGGLPRGSYVLSVVATDAHGNNSIVDSSLLTVGSLLTSERISSSLTDGLDNPFIVQSVLGAVPPPAIESEDDDETDILGAQDKGGSAAEQAKNAAVAATEAGWQLFGVMWYWWLLGAGGLAGAAWWMTALARRRIAEDAL